MSERTVQQKPVLILGAGINGCCVARELALNQVPFWLVDSADIAFGATSRSSRLIHGGLRYLEYRDIGLVRESLQERQRLLRLAPQFVRPLRLAIPVANRLGGLLAGALKFSGLARAGLSPRRSKPRGLWAIRIGLMIYDWLSGASHEMPHRIRANVDVSQGPKLSSSRFRWIGEYSDAQMIFPERFCLALLVDARASVPRKGSQCEVRTWASVRRVGSKFEIENRHGVVETIEPSVVINATGAWGDVTLNSLDVRSKQLFDGTKGSHLYSSHPGLREHLKEFGVYAEAEDGRLVFILPCGKGTLIGTTDLKCPGRPESATATEAETEYFLAMVNRVFDDIELCREDVEMRHAGVRPLPCVASDRTAAIPRGHSIHEAREEEIPVLTLVGGKLTTCRALAEQVADRVMDFLGRTRVANTHEAVIAGGEGWPHEADERTEYISKLADRYSLSTAQAEVVWLLVGNRFAEVFSGGRVTKRISLSETEIPLDFVRWSVENEFVETMSDLVERRLMLIFKEGLSRSTLEDLAQVLVEAGKLRSEDVAAAIDEAIERLDHYYGKTLR